jgi:ribosomal protein S18 acetylase RimI-like enzyme
MPATLPRQLEAPLAADAWLGAILGLPVYRVADAAALADILATEGSDAAAAWRQLLAAAVFVYAKVPTDRPEVTQALEGVGFRVVDTNVTYDKPIPRGTRAADQTDIRMARPEDQEGTVALARTAFRFSRFHLDPAIPAETANRIKGEWAANFFRDQRGEAMILAFAGGQPAGFLQLLVPEPRTLIIDLIAVAESVRRRGLAGRMVAFAEAAFPEAQRIVVGTQIANTPSVRCYEGLGFRLSASAYVLHCHGA